LLDTIIDYKLEWVQIECGVWFTVGLTKKGEVFSWGQNSCGQLGHGDQEARNIPTKIAALDGIVITNISCGMLHTVALTDKGEILTWCVQF
jgi:alpha-tubulin suppressor-like RCC1 family protein